MTLLAARLFGVPIAFVSLIDRDRQWFKAKVGFDLCESSRQASFCAHAILQDEPLVIPNALLDPRFADNPFVATEPFLRFYAGHPLRAPKGEKVGTLCIADTKPHDFSAGELDLLRQLGTMVERELRMSDIIDAQSELLVVQKELLSTQRRLRRSCARRRNTSSRSSLPRSRSRWRSTGNSSLRTRSGATGSATTHSTKRASPSTCSTSADTASPRR